MWWELVRPKIFTSHNLNLPFNSSNIFWKKNSWSEKQLKFDCWKLKKYLGNSKNHWVPTIWTDRTDSYRDRSSNLPSPSGWLLLLLTKSHTHTHTHSQSKCLKAVLYRTMINDVSSGDEKYFPNPCQTNKRDSFDTFSRNSGLVQNCIHIFRKVTTQISGVEWRATGYTFRGKWN